MMTFSFSVSDKPEKGKALVSATEMCLRFYRGQKYIQSYSLCILTLVLNLIINLFKFGFSEL